MKKNYVDWVSEENRKKYFRIEQTIGELENDPTCRGASSTLFWQSYFELKKLLGITKMEDDLTILEEHINDIPISDAERNELLAPAEKFAESKRNDIKFREPNILNRIYEIFMNIRKRLSDQKSISDLDALAFTQLHIVTILLRAICQKASGTPELVDEMVDAGERAFQCFRNQLPASLMSPREALQISTRFNIDIHTSPTVSNSELAEYISEKEDPEKQSLSAVAALFLNEDFKSHKDEEYQKALSVFAQATALWSASSSNLKGELNIQEAVDCCEGVFLNKSTTDDWNSVANSCSLIADNLDDYPDSEDLDMAIDVLDSRGWGWPAAGYWQRASTLAEMEMNPTQWVQQQELERQKIHIIRLKKDFLEDLIDNMEEGSRKSLIQAEINWYDSETRGGRIEATVNELRLVFEIELKAMIIKKFDQSINQVLLTEDLRKQLGIKSKSANRLNLREIAVILKEAHRTDSLKVLPVREFIESLPINKKDKDFLYIDLPKYLDDLVLNARNISEHPTGENPTKIVGHIGDIRRRGLGIGEGGYIARLLNIKKVIKK